LLGGLSNNILSDNAFTYGNLILLYSNFNYENVGPKPDSFRPSGQLTYIDLPDFVKARITLCINTFDIIMKSKPDKFHTKVILIADSQFSQIIVNYLNQNGVSSQYIEQDNTSKSIESVLNNLNARINTLNNPPAIYFVGSVWQKEVFDSIIVSNFKGKLKVVFEGALDHRPYDLIQRDKLTEEPKKGSNYYKQKVKNKAIDSLLNYIFSNKKK
jgi:hypothetical protein